MRARVIANTTSFIAILSLTPISFPISTGMPAALAAASPFRDFKFAAPLMCQLSSRRRYRRQLQLYQAARYYAAYFQMRQARCRRITVSGQFIIFSRYHYRFISMPLDCHAACRQYAIQYMFGYNTITYTASANFSQMRTPSRRSFLGRCQPAVQ